MTHERGRPEYTTADLVVTAPACSTAMALAQHIWSVSRWVARFAQSLARGFPDRVLFVTLLGTSPALSGDRAALPPSTEELGRFLAKLRTGGPKSSPGTWCRSTARRSHE
jgi:hypothetical protein